MPTADALTDAHTFREAMATFPSGVTIVTTVDAAGNWRGFTATSFCSVSAEPPLVSVCLATTAECHKAFAAADRWAIHVIARDQAATALRFATRGADKFNDSQFHLNEFGVPVLEGACVTLSCTVHATYPGGDHTILVGRVEETVVRDEVPAVYFRRGFHALQHRTSLRGERALWHQH